MEVSSTRRYTSNTQILYDLAKGTQYTNAQYKFDDSVYDFLVQQKDYTTLDNYLGSVSENQNETSSRFNAVDYSFLSPQDRLSYYASAFDKEISDEEFNTKYKPYYDQQVELAIDQQVYDSLNAFEKVLATVGGVIGNTLNAAYSTIEGLIDVGAFAVGGLAELFSGGKTDLGTKEFIAKDTTGTGYFNEELNKFSRRYTYIDKSGIAKGINEIFTNIGQMVPMFIPGAGPYIYYGAMAGRTTEDLVLTDPNVDWGSLAAYTVLTTAVEAGTEALSAKIFGGAGNVIDKAAFGNSGKGLTRLGEWAAKHGVASFFLNGISEAAEEMVSEVADNILWNVLIAKDNDDLYKELTMEDVLYAGLIGGLVGNVMDTFSIVTTKRRTINGKQLTRQQTRLLNAAEGAVRTTLDTSKLADLQAKYSNLSLEQIKTQHESEYKKAINYDENQKRTSALAEATAGLAQILDVIGVEKFTKALDIANATFEQTRTLANNYINKIYSTDKAISSVQKLFEIKNPDSSVQISTDLSTTQQRLVNYMKATYDVDVYWGDFGEIDGVKRQHAITLDEHTIVLDAQADKTMSLDKLLHDVVQEELVHTLQFDRSIINAQTLFDLSQAYTKAGGEEITATELDQAYKTDSVLKKITESQAKSMSQALLFDKMTVNRVFTTNNYTFNKIYRLFKRLAEDIQSKKENTNLRGKIKFNTLQKAIKMYRDVATENVGNTESADFVAKEMTLTDDQLADLYNKFLPNETNENFTWVKGQYSLHEQRRSALELELLTNSKKINTTDVITPNPIDYSNALNADNYTDDFVRIIMERNPKQTFETNLQDYCIAQGFIIDTTNQCLMELVDYDDVTSYEFDSVCEAMRTNPREAESITKLSNVFAQDFNSKFVVTEYETSLDNVNINWILTEGQNATTITYTKSDTKTNLPTITVTMGTDAMSPSQIATFRSNFFNAVSHSLADVQGLPNGINSNYVKRTLIEMNDPKTINNLARLLLTEDFYRNNRNNTDVLLNNIAYGVARITDGMYAKESYTNSATKNNDYEINLKDGSTLNRSGFRTDGINIVGYGRFSGIELRSNTINTLVTSWRTNALRNQTLLTAESKTNELYSFLKNNNVDTLRLEKSGFSQEFITLMNNPSPKDSDVKALLNVINEDGMSTGVGDSNATNLVIKYYYPKNTHIKTIEDVNAVLAVDKKGNSGLEYAYVYSQLHQEIKGFDNTEARDKETVRKFAALKVNDEGKRVYDSQKLKENSSLLLEAKDTIDLAKNNQVLVTDLLKSDFDYSVNTTTALFNKMANYGTVDKFKVVEFGTTEEGITMDELVEDKESNVEDIVAERLDSSEEVSSVDKVKETIDNIKKSTQKELRAWLTRQGAASQQANELAFYKRYVDQINSLSETSELSESTKAELNYIKSPDFLIDTFSDVLTEENRTRIIKKLQNNKETLIDIYGKQSAYQKIMYNINKQVKNISPKVDTATIKKYTSMTFYKGTNTAGITEFDNTKGQKTTTTIPGTIWLTDNPYVARTYANKQSATPTVYDTQVTIKNPKIIDAQGQYWSNLTIDGKTTKQIVQEIMNEGVYDSVIFTNIIDVGAFDVGKEYRSEALKPSTDIVVWDKSAVNILKETNIAEKSQFKQEVESLTPTIGETITKKEIAPEKTTTKASELKAAREQAEQLRIEMVDNMPIVQSTPKEYVKKKDSVGKDVELFGQQMFIPIESTEKANETYQQYHYDEKIAKLSQSEEIGQMADKFMNLFTKLSESEYDYDKHSHQYAVLSNEIIQQNEELFQELTPETFWALRERLYATPGKQSATALNAINYYALTRGSTSKLNAIYDFILDEYAIETSRSSQLMGMNSSLYGTHTVKSFMADLTVNQGITGAELPRELILKIFPEYSSVEDYINSLNKKIKSLQGQIDVLKTTKDKFKINELRNELDYNQRITTNLARNDVAAAIDTINEQLLASNENISSNLDKIESGYQAIIKWALENYDADKNNFSNKSGATGRTLGVLQTVQSFTYLMMLSNPATGIKNLLVNAGNTLGSMVEGRGTSFLEQHDWFQTDKPSQAKFYGDYDSTFSDYIDAQYLDKIQRDTKGSRYTTTDMQRLQQQYREEKDPLNKSRILKAIKSYENWMLSDSLWTSKKTLNNFKNTLAGSQPLIFKQVEAKFIALYSKDNPNISRTDLIAKIEKTRNAEISELFSNAAKGDALATLKLAERLKLDIVSTDRSVGNLSIYNFSLERANKLYLKVDNVMTNLRKSIKNPYVGLVLDTILPFVRVTYNTSAYIFEHSPFGIIKGIKQLLSTKTMYVNDMRTQITDYYKQAFVQERLAVNENYKYSEADFDNWKKNLKNNDLNSTLNADLVKSALDGDRKAVKEVFEYLSKVDGAINPNLVGSSNMYARSTALESLSKGINGTAMLAFGVMMAAVLKGFEYDDDEDYLGPVLKIGDLKIALDDLAPFSTWFAIGAMLGSNKVPDKANVIFELLVDNSIFSVVDSAIKYSDNFKDYTENELINLLTRFQPAATKSLSKIIYNTKKDKSGSFFNKLFKTIGSNSLLFNSTVPNKVNPYTGEPLKYYQTGFLESLVGELSPINFRILNKSAVQIEAERLGESTSGLSGNFTINEIKYKLLDDDKEKYSKYRAEYISNMYDKLVSDKEKVTIKDEKTNKFVTKKYSKLTDDEKKRVLTSLYSDATTMTKIRYWLDQGHTYVCSDENQYREYKKILGQGVKYKEGYKGTHFEQ